MLIDFQAILVATAAVAAVAGTTVGCSDSDSGASGADAGAEAGCPAGCPAADAGCPATEAGCPASTPGDVDTPPTGAASALDAWIAKGDYKTGTWKCEAAVRDKMPLGGSPHGKVKVCANAKASAYTGREVSVGAASVKELYKDDGTTRDGTSVSLKVKSGTGGDTWYWYEILGSNVLANSVNNSVCVGCHAKAGAGSIQGGDSTFTIVK